MNLKPYLDDIEQRICEEEELRLEREWLRFADGQCPDPFFAPERMATAPSVAYPDMVINEAFASEENMLYHELLLLSREMEGGKGSLLCVRPNYGTGIIPSLYGAELFLLPDKSDTLPCTRPLDGGKDTLAQAIGKEPTLTSGLGANVFRFADLYRKITADYPKIRRFVHVYNPDLQGPFPLADELWGSGIYYSFYDEPEFLTELLSALTDVFLRFTRAWHEIFPPFDGQHSVEWGLLHRGRCMIRNDAVTNLSAAMYREFVRPFDQTILLEFGAGLHFCGRGDHYVDELCTMENIGCLNLSQPELNDMDRIYAASVGRGIPIVGLSQDEVLRAVRSGTDLKGLVHCGASIAAWKDMPVRF